MSHDRGCHCGRERGEYDDCKEVNCLRRVMKETSAEDPYKRSFAEEPRSLSELRSERENNAALQTPRDALIEVLRKIDSGELKPYALVVVYHCKDNQTGITNGSWMASSPNLETTIGIMQLQAHRMMEASGRE